jgi:hemerythrin-like domain-containing protein
MGSLHAADLIEGRILEREHGSIRTGLSIIKGAIEDAHRLTNVDLADRVARTTAWMHRTFLPHAAWEEAWLYTRVDQETGSAWTTRGLRVQHEQIRELARALETSSTVAHDRWTREIEFELIAAMARLDALLTAHLAEEEMFVLPLLEERATSRQPVGSPGG